MSTTLVYERNRLSRVARNMAEGAAPLAHIQNLASQLVYGGSCYDKQRHKGKDVGSSSEYEPNDDEDRDDADEFYGEEEEHEPNMPMSKENQASTQARGRKCARSKPDIPSTTRTTRAKKAYTIIFLRLLVMFRNILKWIQMRSCPKVLKKDYFNDRTVEQALANKPPNLSQENWKAFVNKWSDTRNKKLCEKNKDNREIVKHQQTTGSRSYPSHFHQIKKHKYNNEDPSPIEFLKRPIREERLEV